MKERPILFSGPMVRAILDGRKTQTRRVVKGLVSDGAVFCPRPMIEQPGMWLYNGRVFPCPYGKPGDRLWVRETAKATASEEGIDCIHYMADDHCRSIMVSEYAAWEKMRAYGGGRARSVPSIHMPRWASRITLEIIGVRVDRLNDISVDDAIAEGITFAKCKQAGQGAVRCFRDLWQSINGPDSWAANPWVWGVEFRRACE